MYLPYINASGRFYYCYCPSPRCVLFFTFHLLTQEHILIVVINIFYGRYIFIIQRHMYAFTLYIVFSNNYYVASRSVLNINNTVYTNTYYTFTCINNLMNATQRNNAINCLRPPTAFLWINYNTAPNIVEIEILREIVCQLWWGFIYYLIKLLFFFFSSSLQNEFSSAWLTELDLILVPFFFLFIFFYSVWNSICNEMKSRVHQMYVRWSVASTNCTSEQT